MRGIRTDEVPVPRAGPFKWPVKQVVIGLLLAGVGLVCVRGAWSLSRSAGPWVDFSPGQVGAGEPADPTVDGRLRFAVATMISAEATFSTYSRLVRRVCRDVGRQEAFVVRPSYAEVRRALEQSEVDVALVCTGTYVHSLAGGRVKLLAQPEFEEPLEYRCLIIVPADSAAQTMKDLRGSVMAFTDPESNTGCLVPSDMLSRLDPEPHKFFSKVIFTGSHDRSILAVALPVVDAAAVDSLVWQSKLQEDPSLAQRVRVLWRSEPFGPPPIVVPVDIDPVLADALQQALLALDEDEEGREILSAIGIKRFVAPDPRSYRSAIELYERLARRGGAAWP